MKLIGQRVTVIVPPEFVGPILVAAGPHKMELQVDEVYAEAHGIKLGPEKKKPATAKKESSGRPAMVDGDGLTAKERVLGYMKEAPDRFIRGADVAKHMRDTGAGSYSNTFSVLVRLAAEGELERSPDGRDYKYVQPQETPVNG